MGKIYCRVFQAIMKVGNCFMPYHTPELLTGAGCSKDIYKVLQKNNIKKVLVVSGKHITASGLNKPMLDSFEANGIEYVLFTDLEPNPTSENVENGLKVYLDNKCEGIVAFGGGTPMDAAKAIAARVVRPGKSVNELQGVLKVGKVTPVIVAVPTTAGTGSETTVAAVITDSATHHKAAINDPALIPAVAVLDPELTLALPGKTTSTTGMDALCHAVEAYTNHTYCTKLENEMALKAIKLIYENIREAYEHGDDIEARQNMQLAAFYAGRAFTRGCVGYVHAVGHTLGGLYGVPHGLAMAVLLPHVLRAYGSSVTKRLAEIARYIGLPGNDDVSLANDFITWIETTNEAMQIPNSFDCIKPEDKPKMIAWAMAEANPLYPVPKVWSKEDFSSFIDSVMAK